MLSGSTHSNNVNAILVIVKLKNKLMGCNFSCLFGCQFCQFWLHDSNHPYWNAHFGFFTYCYHIFCKRAIFPDAIVSMAGSRLVGLSPSIGSTKLLFTWSQILLIKVQSKCLWKGLSTVTWIINVIDVLRY